MLRRRGRVSFAAGPVLVTIDAGRHRELPVAELLVKLENRDSAGESTNQTIKELSMVRLYLSRKEKFLLISSWSDVMEEGDDGAECRDELALSPAGAGDFVDPRLCLGGTKVGF